MPGRLWGGPRASQVGSMVGREVTASCLHPSWADRQALATLNCETARPGHSLLTLLVTLYQGLSLEPRPSQPYKGCGDFGFLQSPGGRGQRGLTQTLNP